MGIRLFETSAKDNINVEEMFRAVTELVLKSKKVSLDHCLKKCFIIKNTFQEQKERLDDPRESGRIKVDGRGRPMGNKNPKGGKCCK